MAASNDKNSADSKAGGAQSPSNAAKGQAVAVADSKLMKKTVSSLLEPVGRFSGFSRYGVRSPKEIIPRIKARPATVDASVQVALNTTREKHGAKYQDFLDKIWAKSATKLIADVVNQINRMRLPSIRKHVLAATFEKNVIDLIDAHHDKEPEDFVQLVLHQQEKPDGALDTFSKALIEEVLRIEHMAPPHDYQLAILLRRLKYMDIPPASGRIVEMVVREINEVLSTSPMSLLLTAYIDRKEIDSNRFTEAIKADMVTYLIERGIRLTVGDLQKVVDGEYDEYFAMAYEYAAASAGGDDDPLTSAQTGTSAGAWDFTVDTFDDVEEQGIVRENIMAAGAIDYIYELGERMGIFKLADALILNWSSGAIDVVEGEAADMLYKYWKVRELRSSPEDRGMLYKRVLNKGDANILSRMVANEHFGRLWHNLMSEVADYIKRTEKIEDGREESSPVSRSRIYQATRELQYNLTEYCTGMAHKQAHEIYKQLEKAIEILSHEDIMTHFGGRHRKSLWTVIEKMSKAEFETSPNIGAIRSLAVDGNKTFQWIAHFDKTTTTPDQFEEFLEGAEAYILNMATVDETPDFSEEEDDDDFDDEFEDEFEDEESDFDDF